MFNEITGIDLIWSEHMEPNENCSYDHVTAKTPFGEYSIEWKSWKKYDAFTIYFEGDYLDNGFDLDEAKNMAQIDFNEKVKASVKVE